MSKRIEIAFAGSRSTIVTATLFEDEAPIACENFWEALAESHVARLHHGRHCAAELWCYLPRPKEEIPYENSTVFPATGDILYYHFIQPPTRQGQLVFDLGIFYSQGQSRLPSGWLPGNLIGRVQGGDDAIRQLELVASDLLRGESVEVTIRRLTDDVAPVRSVAEQGAALESWLGRLDDLPSASTETDVTRVVAAAEQFSQDLAQWLGTPGLSLDPNERARLRDGGRLVGELAAWWRFATDWPVPSDWTGPPVSYWRRVVRHKVHGEPLPSAPPT